jgi:hypothetical protein
VALARRRSCGRRRQLEGEEGHRGDSRYLPDRPRNSTVRRWTLAPAAKVEVGPSIGHVTATSYLATVDGEPTIAASARGHGIGHTDILHAFDHPMWVEHLDEGLLMMIGPDTTGRLLEIGIVEGLDGPVVVHAMHARTKYLR